MLRVASVFRHCTWVSTLSLRTKQNLWCHSCSGENVQDEQSRSSSWSPHTYHTETQLVDHNGPLASQNGHLPVRMDNATAMSSKSGSGGIAALRKLFSRKLLRSTLLIWFVWFANSFAYYGLVLLKSQLSHANRRCTSAQKSSEAHQKNSNLYKDVFITSLAGTVPTITYTYTVCPICFPLLVLAMK